MVKSSVLSSKFRLMNKPKMACMKRPSTTEVFLWNLDFLMEENGDSTYTLAKRAGMSQRTVANIVGRLQEKVSLEQAEALAGAYGLEGWHMIMPNLTDDLRRSPALKKLYEGYVSASPEGRKHIDMVAAREAAYSTKKAEGE
jgi:transcriptional regulator with XRE-family HTH domain